MKPPRLPLSTCLAIVVAASVSTRVGAQPSVPAPLSSESQSGAPAGLNIELSYRAPRTCPSAQRIEREIARLLAGSQVPGTIESQIVVVERAGRFEVLLRLEQPVTGERTIVHENCAHAARAAALIVAISVDPDAATRAHGEQSALDDEPPTSSEPAAEATPPKLVTPLPPITVSEPPSDAAREERASEFRPVALLLGAVAEQGHAPSAAVGPNLGLGLQGRAWRVAVRAAYLPHSSARATGSTAGANFRILWLDLQSCARLGASWFSAGLCGFARQTWTAVEGTGVDEALTETASTRALGAGPHLWFSVNTTLAFEAAFEFEFPLQRPRFVVENLEPVVFRSERVGGALSAGAVLAF